jgi:hypothetical protein
MEKVFGSRAFRGLRVFSSDHAPHCPNLMTQPRLTLPVHLGPPCFLPHASFSERYIDSPSLKYSTIAKMSHQCHLGHGSVRRSSGFGPIAQRTPVLTSHTFDSESGVNGFFQM